MDTVSPLPLIWRKDEGKFAPATSYQLKRCNETFEDGGRYLFIQHLERSLQSHQHYFASLTEAWMNLPEDITHEFPTFEKFRATGLIATGFYNEKRIICADEHEAKRMAAFIAPLAPLAIVSSYKQAVVVRTAKSQSYRAMPKGEFQKSKVAVLAWAWALVGISPEEGNANAGKAA